MIGGHSFFSVDSGRSGKNIARDLSCADFAVLYRTDAQAGALCEALARSGIPFKRHGLAPLAAEPTVRALLNEIDREPGDRHLAVQLQLAAKRLQDRGEAPDAGALVMARGSG